VVELEEDNDDEAAIERISDALIGILIAIIETELEFGIVDAGTVASGLVILLLPSPTCVGVGLSVTDN
jgi:hypothetical protein